jgi:hypothetical protein
MIRDNIEELRDAVKNLTSYHSYRQLEKILGVKYSTIYRFCLGGNIHPELLHAIEKGIISFEKDSQR